MTSKDMSLVELLRQLAEISLMQSQIIAALYVERWPIGVIAQQHKCSISRIKSEEAAGFRNMTALLLGGDGFDAAHADYVKRIEAEATKDAAKKSRAKSAVGSKLKRSAGPSE